MKNQIYTGISKLRHEGFFEAATSVAGYLQSMWLTRLILLVYGKLLYNSNGMWIYYDLLKNEKIAVPHWSDWHRGRKKYSEQLNQFYFRSDFSELEDGDIVFDVGAYVGITSRIASRTAKKIYAIEPSPRARRCLEFNVETYDNIEILPYAAWNKSEEIDLMYGGQPSEDGLIEPDDGGTGERVSVQAHSISVIAELENVDRIDFLKIEAEGVEPEVVDGIDSGSIRKVVSTGNAERFGKTTYGSVSEKLQKYGYNVKVCPTHDYQMVYAKAID